MVEVYDIFISLDGEDGFFYYVYPSLELLLGTLSGSCFFGGFVVKSTTAYSLVAAFNFIGFGTAIFCFFASISLNGSFLFSFLA